MELRDYHKQLNQSGLNSNAINKRLGEYEEQISYLEKEN